MMTQLQVKMDALKNRYELALQKAMEHSDISHFDTLAVEKKDKDLLELTLNKNLFGLMKLHGQTARFFEETFKTCLLAHELFLAGICLLNKAVLHKHFP